MAAQDHVPAAGEVPIIRRFKYISPGLFRTLGIPLVAGRDLTWTDIYSAREVALVSENLARELWGAPPAALGKRIRGGTNGVWREIIGVARDVYDNGVYTQPPAMVYWPARLQPDSAAVGSVRSVTFAIGSTRAGTASFLDQIRQAVWAVNPDLPLAQVTTLSETYQRSMARTSFTLVMLAIAGGMALLLGVISIYGVIAYTVSQRNREIGIRLALGAQPGELKRMFVSHGLALACIGAAIGLAAAASLTRFMSSLLFGVSATDPLTFLVVPAVLAGAAALASYVPARRAAEVDPVEALRAE
jgi:predicted permease